MEMYIMSLSVFLNEINKDTNNESVLEAYTYFGIDYGVAVESAMDTIKEKVKNIFKKIGEWIERFIKWVKGVFKKKVVDVAETIQEEKKLLGSDSKKSSPKKAMVDKDALTAFDSNYYKLKDAVTYTISKAEQNRGHIDVNPSSEHTNEEIALDKIKDITTSLNNIHINENGPLIEFNKQLFSHYVGMCDMLANDLRDSFSKNMKSYKWMDISNYEEYRKEYPGMNEKSYNKFITETRKYVSDQTHMFNVIISAFMAVERSSMLILNNIKYK
jgi:hypothetical protein